MKALVNKASEGFFHLEKDGVIIEIKSLEHLLNFQNEIGHDLMISMGGDSDGKYQFTILVCDSYLD